MEYLVDLERTEELAKEPEKLKDALKDRIRAIGLSIDGLSIDSNVIDAFSELYINHPEEIAEFRGRNLALLSFIIASSKVFGEGAPLILGSPSAGKTFWLTKPNSPINYLLSQLGYVNISDVDDPAMFGGLILPGQTTIGNFNIPIRTIPGILGNNKDVIIKGNTIAILDEFLNYSASTLNAFVQFITQMDKEFPQSGLLTVVISNDPFSRESVAEILKNPNFNTLMTRLTPINFDYFANNAVYETLKSLGNVSNLANSIQYAKLLTAFTFPIHALQALGINLHPRSENFLEAEKEFKEQEGSLKKLVLDIVVSEEKQFMKRFIDDKFYKVFKKFVEEKLSEFCNLQNIANIPTNFDPSMITIPERQKWLQEIIPAVPSMDYDDRMKLTINVLNMAKQDPSFYFRMIKDRGASLREIKFFINTLQVLITLTDGAISSPEFKEALTFIANSSFGPIGNAVARFVEGYLVRTTINELRKSADAIIELFINPDVRKAAYNGLLHSINISINDEVARILETDPNIKNLLIDAENNNLKEFDKNYQLLKNEIANYINNTYDEIEKLKPDAMLNLKSLKEWLKSHFALEHYPRKEEIIDYVAKEIYELYKMSNDSKLSKRFASAYLVELVLASASNIIMKSKPYKHMKRIVEKVTMSSNMLNSNVTNLAFIPFYTIVEQIAIKNNPLWTYKYKKVEIDDQNNVSFVEETARTTNNEPIFIDLNTATNPSAIKTQYYLNSYLTKDVKCTDAEYLISSFIANKIVIDSYFEERLNDEASNAFGVMLGFMSSKSEGSLSNYKVLFKTIQPMLTEFKLQIGELLRDENNQGLKCRYPSDATKQLLNNYEGSLPLKERLNKNLHFKVIKSIIANGLIEQTDLKDTDYTGLKQNERTSADILALMIGMEAKSQLANTATFAIETTVEIAKKLNQNLTRDELLEIAKKTTKAIDNHIVSLYDSENPEETEEDNAKHFAKHLKGVLKQKRSLSWR